MVDNAGLLKEGLRKLDINGGERVSSLLIKYIEEIELFNPAYGLVKVKDRRELIIKHILDSLAPLNIFFNLPGKTQTVTDTDFVPGKPAVRRVADIGSGAGLPGIPLAICMSGAEFILVERMGRRAGFLHNVLAVLGLPNARVEETEMEKLAADPSAANSFNLIVFRAWKPLNPDILKALSKILAPRGIIAAYKGRRESIEEEIAGLIKTKEEEKSSPSGNGGAISGEKHSLVNFSSEIYPLEVPFLEEERHLLLLQI